MSDMDIMYISMFSTVAPAVLSVIFFRRTTFPLKVLGVFIILHFAFEIVAHVIFLSDMNNMWVFHIYTFLEFSVVSWIYFLLFKSSILKRLVLLSVAAFYVVSFFVLEIDLKAFNSDQNVIKTGFVLMYCVLFISEFFKRQKSSDFKLHPYFVLTSGFLIYFAGTITVFMFGDEYLNERDLSPWVIHCVLNVFLNGVYCYTLWETKKQEIY